MPKLKHIFYLAFFIFGFTAHAQQLDTLFMDNQWKPVAKNENPYYYRISEKLNDSISAFKDYYLDGTIQNSGQYNNGLMFGRWKYFTREGVLKSEVEYDGSNSKPKVILYDEYKLKPNRDSVYFTLNKNAHFGSDSASIHDYINANFKLPPKAIKKGIKTFSMVWIVVIDKDGKVNRATRIKVSPKNFEKRTVDKIAQFNKDYKFEIQESLERFLKNMPTWTPGYLFDKPVKQAQYLEIHYKKK